MVRVGYEADVLQSPPLWSRARPIPATRAALRVSALGLTTPQLHQKEQPQIFKIKAR